MYKAQDSELKNLKFNSLKLRFYDDKNKEHLFTLRNVSNCWEEKTYQADKDWILAK